MEIDRIDKNNIRVFLVHKDLEERGVTILDLLGNQMQVEKFFYSILEEVDTDHSFSGTQAVTFQVMPNEDGLELLISKTPRNYENNINSEIKKNNISNSSAFNLDAAARSTNVPHDHDLLDIGTQEDIIAGIKKYRQQRYLRALKSDDLTYVARFDSIEDLINLGHFMTMKVKSILYTYNDKYYVMFSLYKKDANQKNYISLVTSVNEYGSPSDISSELIIEHGKVLIKNNVFQVLNNYF